MRSTLAIAALLSLSGAGCASLQTISSGYVGCSPNEIEISNEASDFSGMTWTATCRGTVYHCARINNAGHATVVTGKTTGSASIVTTSVSCAPEGGASAQSRPTTPSSPPAEAARAPSKPPTAAVGFTFGSNLAAAEKACVGASLTWRAAGNDRYECSGSPADVGMPVTTAVGMCGGRVCSVLVNANPRGEGWSVVMERYVKLRKALEAKYGDQELTDTLPFKSCTEGVRGCLAKGRARVIARWNWQGSSSVALTAMGSQNDAPPELKIEYRDADGGKEQVQGDAL